MEQKNERKRDKNRLLYKKVKKASFWGSIISFIITMIMVAVIMTVTLWLFASYVAASKLQNEYDRIENLAKMYEAGDNSVVHAVLDNGENDYVVLDSSGQKLHTSGTDTRMEGPEKADLSEFLKNVDIYRDSERNIFYVSEGRLRVNWGEVFKYIGNEAVEIQADEQHLNDGDEYITVYSDDDFYENGTKIINFPLWIAVDVKDGAEKFAGKASFSVNVNDLFLFGIVSIIIIVLVLILLITMLVNVISSIVRQIRIVGLFFEDPITKGHNWMYFLIRGEQYLRKGRAARDTYAVVNMVLVNYRNYCLCHSVEDGEKLLGSIYNKVQRSLSPKEMCAHTTASNFALILNVSDEDSAKRRLYEIISDIRGIDQEHKLSMKVGVDIVRPWMDAKGRVVKRKSFSMDTSYNNACTARASIEDTDETEIVIFDEKLVEEEKWLDMVQEKQEQAVRNEEFQVYYQPKYDPRTNVLRGAEALIRWESPDFGFVTPGRFIPIFEKNGFITEIDHYMLTHVARDQKRWLDEGYNLVPVSVNVSRAHFVESDLAEQIRDMVDREGAPHNLIEIELTESAFFDDKKAMIDTIRKLKEYGFTVSMDDFGSGYSSLNSLKDMPLDVLKLDADFFRGSGDDGRGEIVVSEAIKLAQSLNMRTVAEGVEVKDQVDFLAAEGCDMIQGYYFAKPMPVHEYESRMKNGFATV